MRFEYDITKHPAESFNELIYYCTDKGECSQDSVLPSQTEMLQKLLNERGWQGWELIQIFINQSGILAFWKRKLNE